MSSLNKVTLIGRVGKDPEIRNAGNGKPIVSFSLATSESWKDKQGQKQEKTEWHNITCFNEALCRVIENYVKKGSQI
jgi:single-strand DNA-binding protein